MPKIAPQVSVIIPAYNAQGTVGRAIDSVLAQAYTSIEIVVVDDGSTDGTAQAVQSYGSPVRYIYQTNQERSAARNTGIDHAGGDLIAFLDADDYWLPNKLERQMRALLADSQLGFIYSLAYSVTETGHQLHAIGRCLPKNDRRSTFSAFLIGNLIPSPTPLMYREVVETVGYFDISLISCEDHDYWMRVAKLFMVGCIDEPLAAYTISGPQYLHRLMRTRATESLITVVEKHSNTELADPSTIQLALSLAWFKSALIEAGVENADSAEFRLRRALDICPELLSEQRQLTIEIVVDFASQLCLGSLDDREGFAFLDLLASTLNDVDAVYWKLARGQFHTSRFFQAAQYHDEKATCRSFFPMVFSRPGFLLNRGIWSILVKNLYHTLQHNLSR